MLPNKLIHLAKRLHRTRFFRNQPIRNKNSLWRLCLLKNRDEMSILYRGHAIDASYQVSVHLAMWCQRRFKKIGQSEKKLPMVAMFVNGSERNEQSLYASYQVLIHLAKRLQRRRFFRNQPIRNKNCLWRPCLLTDRN